MSGSQASLRPVSTRRPPRADDADDMSDADYAYFALPSMQPPGGLMTPYNSLAFSAASGGSGNGAAPAFGPVQAKAWADLSLNPPVQVQRGPVQQPMQYAHTPTPPRPMRAYLCTFWICCRLFIK